MRLKIIPAVLGLGLIMLMATAYFYQFGPVGIKAGDDRILAKANLLDGSRLFVVAHRTGHPIDAYEVSLYRVYPKGEVSVCFLGHEEAYWWWCSLQPSDSNENFSIRAFGIALGSYSATDGKFTWSDKKRGSFPSYKIDGIKVKCPIPSIISTNSQVLTPLNSMRATLLTNFSNTGLRTN